MESTVSTEGSFWTVRVQHSCLMFPILYLQSALCFPVNTVTRCCQVPDNITLRKRKEGEKRREREIQRDREREGERGRERERKRKRVKGYEGDG